MFPLMLDTPPEQRRRYYAMLRRMTPEERGRTAFALTGMVRRMAAASIRSDHPGISEWELRARMAVRLYGREAARRLFPDVPDDAR